MSFDFQHAVSAPFRMQPGLRRLAPGATQLTPNHPGARHLLAKLAVFVAAHERALIQQPGFDPGPALAALAQHAAQEHPDAIRLSGDGLLHALRLGWSVDEQGEIHPAAGIAAPSSHEPACEPAYEPESASRIGQCLGAVPPAWRRAALLALAFEEDFAIVDGRRASIPWLAVALPSHWAPVDKVGRHFAEIHAPVADNRVLLAAGEHLMRLVTRDERWERFVWTITRHAGLDNHPARLANDPWPVGASPEEVAARAFFRTERQTFIPVGGHDQAIFTIQVDSRPLAQAITQPDQAAALREAVSTMSPAVLAYRSLGEVREPVLAWLERQSQSAA